MPVIHMWMRDHMETLAQTGRLKLQLEGVQRPVYISLGGTQRNGMRSRNERLCHRAYAGDGRIKSTGSGKA